MKIEEYIDFLSTFLDKKRVNSLVKSMEKEPYHCLRINPFKKVPSDFTDLLEKHQIINNAYYFDINNKLGNNPLHHAGAYYIQDASAMLVGHLLNVKEDDLVIDLCAAPGGKSTFVAPLLTKGLLISNDYSSARCVNLIDNIERMGINNVIVINNEIKDIANNLTGLFDKVILDAPCSGEGMFRKNNLVKEDWSIEKVNYLKELQKELILNAYKLLKKEGLLIYSTCTFNKLENEEVIKYLLNNTNASLIALPSLDNADRGINMDEAIRLFPDKFKGEGHFICLIKCNDEHEKVHVSSFKSNINDKQLRLFRSFEEENFKTKLNENRLFVYNNLLYYVPENTFNISNLKIKRQGILLGELDNNLFKPDHALGTSFKDIFKRTINFDYKSIEADKYIRGESFKIDAPNGYTQILINDCPLDVCKISNGMIKNAYPKKLRKIGL